MTGLRIEGVSFNFVWLTDAVDRIGRRPGPWRFVHMIVVKALKVYHTVLARSARLDHDERAGF